MGLIRTCERCKIEFNKKSNYLNHINRKFKCILKIPKKEIIIEPIIIHKIPSKLECKYCNRIFSRSDALKIHIESRCKVRKEKEKEKEKFNNIFINRITELEEKNKKMEEEINKLKSKKPNNIQPNIIINNINNDENVEKKLDNINENITKITQTNPINEQLFNIIVRKDKKIEELQTKNINDNQYIENNQIINLDESNFNNTINNKDKRIKLLEDLCLQKHKRVEYPGTNVIYMLTTEEHKKNRIYIIGKAKNLKSRLSTYNKTLEHEVVYYKECKNVSDMELIEKMVLNKLNSYKEVANRDRFILPIENDISLFNNQIDNAIKYFN